MYHILITKQHNHSQGRDIWSVEFGDYDRSVVKAEYESLSREYSRKNIKIVTIVSDTQAAIDHAIDCYNSLEM